MTRETLHARFQRLLESHRGIVLKVASVYCRHPDDRRDLEQEILLQWWRSFPRYDDARRFSTWAYRVALNVAISFTRGRGRRTMASLSAGAAEPVDERTGPIEPDERLRALYDIIGRLSGLDRALLLLYLEEQSSKDMAEVLGLTSTNVTTKISRLKERIRGELAQAAHGQRKDGQAWNSTT